jgi:hypothetical protein
MKKRRVIVAPRPAGDIVPFLPVNIGPARRR